MIATEMDITLASSTIAVGETTSLSLAVLPTSAANYINVSLSSSNEKVATVNNFGKVTGVAPGKATITATDGNVSCTATVTVVAANTSTVSSQSISLNTNYVVLKPGSSKTITGKVSPASASQSLTFKSQDKSIATVSGSGVITGVATGATSVVVSNGTASTSVTVIVNRTASTSGSSSDTSGEGTEDNVTTDATVAAIQNAAGEEVSLYQSDVPAITGEILSALRTTGRSLIVLGEDYTLRIDGTGIKSTQGGFSTALTFAPDENGLSFQLGENGALPCVVQITLTGENAAYSRPVSAQHCQRKVAVPEQLQGWHHHRRYGWQLPADQPESALHQYQLDLLHRRRCADRGLPDRVYRRQETVLVLVSITVRNKTSRSFEWEVFVFIGSS